MLVDRVQYLHVFYCTESIYMVFRCCEQDLLQAFSYNNPPIDHISVLIRPELDTVQESDMISSILQLNITK